MMRTAKAGRSLALGLACVPVVALPQVVRDGTIGPGASLQPAGPAYDIPQNMGALAGSNLFHSFAEFSLSQGQSATFTGSLGIDNVIARVTGVDPSFIDGALRSEIQGADLWLVNPRGVMFGPHASLNLSGSLNLSTANSLDFDDGTALGAQAAPAPLLSVAAPTEFRLLGGAPGRIDVDGSVLQNPGGFGLRSGVIEVSGGGALAASTSTAARGGDIDLVASDRISLIDTPPVVGRQIFGTLDSRTLGPGAAGAIRLEAPVVELVDGGSIRSLTVGSGAGAEISVVASEQFKLSGTTATLEMSSQITTVTASTGAGGNLHVDTQSFAAEDAAGLWSYSNGPGAGGSIDIAADRIVVEEGSTIGSVTTGSGRGGDIAATAPGQIQLGGA
jgi:filamentous hemagglutinin family protein